MGVPWLQCPTERLCLGHKGPQLLPTQLQAITLRSRLSFCTLPLCVVPSSISPIAAW